MKILISGYYGFKNIGDELILSKLIDDITSIVPGASITVVSGNPEYTRMIHNVDAVNRFLVDELITAIKESDIIVVGGGGLIHDYFGGIDVSDLFKSCGYNVVFYAFTPLVGRIFQKRIFYWTHGVGPLFSDNAQLFAKWFYTLSDFTTLRDSISYKILKDIYPEIKNLYVDTDPVINIDIKKFINPSPFELPSDKIKIGINIRPWFNIDEVTEKLCDALVQLSKESSNIVIVPIPFDLSMDYKVLRKFVHSIPQRFVFQYDFEKLDRPNEVISLMNNLDYFVGMRLHSIIISRLLKIPTIALSYDLKTDSFSDLLNIPKISTEEITVDNFLGCLKNLISLPRQDLSDVELTYKSPSYFRDFINNEKILQIESQSNSNGCQSSSISKIAKSLEGYNDLRGEINRYQEDLSFLKGQISNLENRLNSILSSKTWKLGQLYGRLIGVESPLRRRLEGIFIKKKSKAIDREDSKSNQEDLLLLERKGKLLPLARISRKVYQYDIICFPIIDWFFRYQRPQQILSHFAKNGSRVFYINPRFSGQQKDGITASVIKENIFEINISGTANLNIYRDTIDEINLLYMMDSIEALRRETGIIEAICIVQLPFWQPLVKEIKNKYGWKIMYDCMDEHSGFSTNEESMIVKEQLLTATSDLLVTTSLPLYEKMKIYNDRCILVPNAADFDHFNHLPPNDLLNNLKKPIIGYYGAISDWFDNELVEYLASKKKDWNFVLIGHTFGADISKLENMSNVHLLGEKPYNELPKYLYWFDVCIIPFKLNKLIQATNPVKFYEFMCSGKKVVSIKLPELVPYKRYCYLAENKEDFLEKIERALNENDQNIVAERIAFARENTWERRYEVLRSEIKKLYPLVSIIIVTYNNLEFTKICIDSIFSKTQYPNFELIIVDNFSKDGTREYLQELLSRHPNIKVIFNETNQGFAKANNKGICAASGEYIVFLNNDTIVTRGWLSKLIKYLQDEQIGLVGPITNWCGNEAKLNVSYKSIDELEEFSEEYIRNNMETKCFDISMLAFYCVATRRNVIEKVGLLDERFEIGLFEDDDYSYRVRLNGYRVVCAEDIFIHHFGETSFNKLKQDGSYSKIFEENKRKFEEKWHISWKPHSYR